MILLDDQGSQSSASSRLYENPRHVLAAWSTCEVPPLLELIEERSFEGTHWVIALGYRLGSALNGLPGPRGKPDGQDPSKLQEMPILTAWGFDGYRRLTQTEVGPFLKASQTEGPNGLILSDSFASKSIYCEGVERAQQEIANGTFYQINLTFPIRGHYYGDPVGLYAGLRKQQPTALSALWLNFQEGQHLLSFSPELFLRCRDGRVTAEPMKGTCSISEDATTRLVDDPKNKAENIMIVDLLRNDLGQVCKTGSISTPSLLSIQTVGSLYQMTSEISGELREGVGLMDVLKAAFPCGSVTGAPKRKSMEWIDRLEAHDRGVYCGALGWLDPPKPTAPAPINQRARARLGDFEWSVLIRSLVLNSDQTVEMGVGAGITIDSVPEQEWQESLSKAGFLISLPKQIGLFETMRTERKHVERLDQHIARLLGSAASFGISLGREDLLRAIDDALASIQGDAPMRLRLAVRADGSIDIKIALLKTSPRPVIFWASALLNSIRGTTRRNNPLLAHKIDRRPDYDDAWRAAESEGGFDALFVNDAGEVTEGGRSNVFIKKDGVWLTPPLSCGLLPGIMRAELLASKDWNARESVIYPTDVKSAQEIVVCNSLRGAINVKLEAK